VLRVDELSKLAGVPCPELTAGSGCGIYATRPKICRSYRCLWLKGGLEEGDRPDRLGAVLDLFAQGTGVRLEIRQARRDAFDRSPRLQEIAEQYRSSMPVRITDVDDVLDPDRPFRVLLADGEENRVTGDVVETYRGGRHVGTQRAGWPLRAARQVQVWARKLRLRRFGPTVGPR
jgi:Fe-S-cluster containining protein